MRRLWHVSFILISDPWTTNELVFKEDLERKLKREISASLLLQGLEIEGIHLESLN
jgi:hypothetical protein